jgi:hypothetical protein
VGYGNACASGELDPGVVDAAHGRNEDISPAPERGIKAKALARQLVFATIDENPLAHCLDRVKESSPN